MTTYFHAIHTVVSAFVICLFSCQVVRAQAQQRMNYVDATDVACKIGRPNVTPGESVTWQGKCVNGLASGPGVAQWSKNGKPTFRYQGVLQNGLIEGKGQMTTTAGDKYEGSYIGGMRNGYGVYTSADGTRYEGNFKNNVRDGVGTLISATGQRSTGNFRDGKLVSQESASDSRSEGQKAAGVQANSQVGIPPIASGGASSETFSFTMNACSDTLTSVFGIIPRSIDLKSGPSQGRYTLNTLPIALKPLLQQASQFASEHCATKRCDPSTAFAVGLFHDRMPRVGEPDVTKWDPMPVISASCPSGGATNPTWEIFNSVAYDESPEGKAAKQRQQQRQAVRSAAVESQNKSKAFFEKNGVTGFYNVSLLNRNPFAMEGKNVLLWARLSQMLDSSKALIDATEGLVVVSDIPKGAFGSGYYLFVGKVLGNTNFQGNIEQTPVALLRFVSAIPCPSAEAVKCMQ
jgi:hypothetical protein